MRGLSLGRPGLGLAAAAALLAGLAVEPGTAVAQPVDGLYIGAGGGYNYRNEIDLREHTQEPFDRGKYVDGAGYIGVGSIGYGLGDGWRFEIEGNYRGPFQKLKFRDYFNSFRDGRLDMYGAMANALFDLDVGSPYVFPYLGVGAGFAETHRYYRNQFYQYDGTNDEVAFQAIAGLSFPVPYLVGLSVTAEARAHIVPVDSNIEGTTRIFPVANFPGGEGAYRDHLGHQYNFSGLIGLRYAFDVPPPPPPPAPAQPAQEPPVQPTRSYLVFFDWDKATLTERARQIIHEAADNSTKVQYTRIEVNGYTDTSGTPKYNQGLSIRRAQAVEAELVRDGVPRQSISIQGFGETHLLVATGPGVREPQNRRVEIIIR